MKTHRKSHSTENRNARKEMLVRGYGRFADASLPPSMPISTDRRWRRANRKAFAETARLGISTFTDDGITAPANVFATGRHGAA